MKNGILLLVLISFSGFVTADELYHSAKHGDSGKYYVLNSEDLGDRVIQVVSSRVGNGDAYTDFTKLKINCKTRQYFVLAGVSEDGVKKQPSKKFKNWSKNSKWIDLVAGSSKYDLVNYICEKYK